MTDLTTWIGRTETLRDEIAAAALRGLAALLDYDAPPWAAAPLLAHWLCFQPTARQSAIDADGHPPRGGFLPPVTLPRRMWAGGRLTFLAPLRVGATLERVSTIKDVAAKTGASGEMVFVTVAHEVRADGVPAVQEEQDIVYRAPAGAAPPAAPDTRVVLHARDFRPDAVALFRFSALTFNAHRIHYDRAYATGVEGYPGLVVQGPYIAMALLDHFTRIAPDAVVRRFTFRAQRPLFDGDAATLCIGADNALWCRNGAGETVMSAQVETG